MKKEKTGDKKYPLKITLSTGESIIIPRQSQFENKWLNKHGCSLMAEYIAFQWLGVKKIKVGKKRVHPYPINLLRWHKKHTPEDIAAKVLIKAIVDGVAELTDGRAKYYKTVTKARMTEALDKGKLVVFEQKDPIHTVILIPDDGVWVASHGTVKKTTVGMMMKTVLKSTKYRGMVVIAK